MEQRKDYISWDEYFMGIALLTAMRSKDPNSQVGACIVSPENKILSLGYNGMPIGCPDDEMPWGREGDPLDTKYMYVCHADLCDPLSLQRMHQGPDSKRHRRGDLPVGQIPRHPGQRGQPPHDEDGRHQVHPLHPQGPPGQL